MKNEIVLIFADLILVFMVQRYNWGVVRQVSRIQKAFNEIEKSILKLPFFLLLVTIFTAALLFLFPQILDVLVYLILIYRLSYLLYRV